VKGGSRAETYSTTQDGTAWKLCSNRIFIPNSVLDEHDGCCIVDHWGKRLGYCVLIDGFVETNDVIVVTGCIGGVADH
jgi:hypothetical protein